MYSRFCSSLYELVDIIFLESNNLHIIPFSYPKVYIKYYLSNICVIILNYLELFLFPWKMLFNFNFLFKINFVKLKNVWYIKHWHTSIFKSLLLVKVNFYKSNLSLAREDFVWITFPPKWSRLRLHTWYSFPCYCQMSCPYNITNYIP